MPGKFDLKARVIENICLGGKYFRVRIEAPEIAGIARAGQFCMIRPEECGENLMRRPFSIAAVREGAIVEFAYTAIGRGTRLLAAMKANEILLCLGPLGNSFPVVEGVRAMVVAGGIGMAPFPFLNDVLNRHRIFPTTYYGARTADELIYIEEFHQLSERVVLTTDDGSTGFHGFVTDVFERDLQQSQEEVVIYACGPHSMLGRVKAIAEKFGAPAYLSMEEVMGCGVGICIGCPVPGITSDGRETYYLCCQQGPIFPSTMVRI